MLFYTLELLYISLAGRYTFHGFLNLFCRHEDAFGFAIHENCLVALTTDRKPLKFHRVDYPHGQQVKINYEIHFPSKEGPAYVFHQERDVSLFHVVTKEAAMLAFKMFRWCVKSTRSETRHHWDLQRYECSRMTIAALRCCCFRITCPEHYEREMKFLVSKNVFASRGAAIQNESLRIE